MASPDATPGHGLTDEEADQIHPIIPDEQVSQPDDDGIGITHVGPTNVPWGDTDTCD